MKRWETANHLKIKAEKETKTSNKQNEKRADNMQNQKQPEIFHRCGKQKNETNDNTQIIRTLVKNS